MARAAGGVFGLGLALVGLGACHRAPAAAAPPGPVLRSARTAAPPAVDGKLEDAAWLATPHSDPLTDLATGRRGSPDAEVRALWDERALYLGLYAAGEDLELGDRFGVVLSAAGTREVAFALDPSGKLHAGASPVPDGVVAAVDTDGTIGDARDDDEEWTAELVIPWAALGLAGPKDLALTAYRVDHPAHGPGRHLRWRGRLELIAPP